jgi:hypothetical protein
VKWYSTEVLNDKTSKWISARGRSELILWFAFSPQQCNHSSNYFIINLNKYIHPPQQKRQKHGITTRLVSASFKYSWETITVGSACYGQTFYPPSRFYTWWSKLSEVGNSKSRWSRTPAINGLMNENGWCNCSARDRALEWRLIITINLKMC